MKVGGAARGPSPVFVPGVLCLGRDTISLSLKLVGKAFSWSNKLTSLASKSHRVIEV